MLVTSIFFFSHNVFRRLFPSVRQKSSLCGKGLRIEAVVLTSTLSFHQSEVLTLSKTKHPFFLDKIVRGFFHLDVCVRSVEGCLSQKEIDIIRDDQVLLGTAGMIFVLPAPVVNMDSPSNVSKVSPGWFYDDNSNCHYSDKNVHATYCYIRPLLQAWPLPDLTLSRSSPDFLWVCSTIL